MEIKKQSNRPTAKPKILDQLGIVRWKESLHGFDFYDDGVVHHEIDPKVTL